MQNEKTESNTIEHAVCRPAGLYYYSLCAELADGLILATDGEKTLYLIEPDPSGFKARSCVWKSQNESCGSSKLCELQDMLKPANYCTFIRNTLNCISSL